MIIGTIVGIAKVGCFVYTPVIKDGGTERVSNEAGHHVESNLITLVSPFVIGAFICLPFYYGIYYGSLKLLDYGYAYYASATAVIALLTFSIFYAKRRRKSRAREFGYLLLWSLSLFLLINTIDLAFETYLVVPYVFLLIAYILEGLRWLALARLY